MLIAKAAPPPKEPDSDIPIEESPAAHHRPPV
jgi:hypothetical protein